MFIQFKAKGILVPIYVIVPLASLFFLSSIISDYFFNEKSLKHFSGIIFGLSLIISGFWTNYSSNDYYIDEDGEKQYMYFDNQFMFIDMKSWAYVFWIIGGVALVGSLIELITKSIN